MPGGSRCRYSRRGRSSGSGNWDHEAVQYRSGSEGAKLHPKALERWGGVMMGAVLLRTKAASANWRQAKGR